MYADDDYGDGFVVFLIIILSFVIFMLAFFASVLPFSWKNGRMECNCGTKNKMVQSVDKYNAAIEEWDKTVKERNSGRVESL